MAVKTICVLGGTGFVGHHLVSRLSQAGYRVRVPSRNRERHRSLFVLPGVDVVDCNIFDENQLKSLFSSCDAVINLVAILNQHKRGEFNKVHVELPGTIANACWGASVHRLLHMSALNADAHKGTSAYLRSKGEGESVVLDSDGLDVTVFRPSVIFGPDDHFFNTFAQLLNTLPVLPLVCPQSLMAPVFVGDVVDAMIKSINDTGTFGQTYDLCGPHAYTLEQLVKYTAGLVNPKRRILPLGNVLSALQARVMGMLPGSPLSYDNYLSLQTPAVCQTPFPARFGIIPSSVEKIVPYYVGRADIRGRYDAIRRHAARDESLRQ